MSSPSIGLWEEEGQTAARKSKPVFDNIKFFLRKGNEPKKGKNGRITSKRKGFMQANKRLSSAGGGINIAVGSS